MTAAAVTPATPMPARTFPNRYTCSCDTCGSSVARGEGSVRRATRRDRDVRAAGRRWVVTCAPCDGGGLVYVPESACEPVVPDVDAYTAKFVQPLQVVPVKPVKVSDGYKLTSHGNVRCVGCGMLKGGGHYQGCNRRQLTTGRVYPDTWLKPAVKPGTAAHAKLQASVVNRLATIETDRTLYTRCREWLVASGATPAQVEETAGYWLGRGYINTIGKGC